ncbi:MAG: flagellar protein FlgN [Candidatus Gastranaerophilales bacterium]|nr:flagellar protein FlgN [Candidatus Gastranaerophilales bacterium]
MQIDFEMLENCLNEEITLYKELENLYKEKQEILTKRDVEKLEDIDSTILKHLDSVKSLIEKRKTIAVSTSGKVMTLSEVVEAALSVDKNQADKFTELQNELNSLVKELIRQERLNNELTKYGIKTTNKIMQIILNEVAIPTKEYNQKGKMVEQSSLNISSVSEEV